MKVSVAIPSYNSRDTIEPCLNSVFDQHVDVAYEVFVIDSSDDDTSSIIATRFPQVNLVALSHKTGSGAARNIGVEASSGDIVVFLDSDCTVDRTWLDRMISPYTSSGCDAVAGSVANGNPESLVSWASYITEFSEYMPVGVTHERISSPTCNISYRREVFRDCGGFDEHLRLYVDYEFNSRIRRHGKRLLFDPGITVKHWHRTSIPDYTRHELQRGRAAVMLRRAGLLPSSWVVGSRAICAMSTPALLGKRIISDARRFLPAGMVSPSQLRRIAPIFLLGSCSWGLGFLLEGLRPSSSAYTPTRGRRLRL